MIVELKHECDGEPSECAVAVLGPDLAIAWTVVHAVALPDDRQIILVLKKAEGADTLDQLVDARWLARELMRALTERHRDQKMFGSDGGDLPEGLFG